MDELLPNPSVDAEDEESKMISLAVRQAEKQLIEGTASSQIVVHYLRLGSKKAELELENAVLQNRLLEERIVNERSAAEINNLFVQVMESLTEYKAFPEEEFYENN